MTVTPTSNPDVLLVEPRVFHDERGLFFESYNSDSLAKAGITCNFVQDNHSVSKKNVLRGLHYQIENAQGKLVRVVAGEIFDIAVDLRRWSPYFGKSVGMTLSAANRYMLWIPPGFAHGFLVLSDQAEVLYKATDFYRPQHERTIVWNDPDLAIDWPGTEQVITSAKDQSGKRFRDAEVYEVGSLDCKPQPMGSKV